VSRLPVTLPVLARVQHGDLERTRIHQESPHAIASATNTRHRWITGSPEIQHIGYIVDTLTATVPYIQRVTFEVGADGDADEPERFPQLVNDLLPPTTTGRP